MRVAETLGVFLWRLFAGSLLAIAKFTQGKPLFEPDLLILRKFWLAVMITSAFGGAVLNLAFVYVGGSIFRG